MGLTRESFRLVSTFLRINTLVVTAEFCLPTYNLYYGFTYRNENIIPLKKFGKNPT